MYLHLTPDGKWRCTGLDQPPGTIVCATRDDSTGEQVLVLKVPGHTYYVGNHLKPGYQPVEYQVWKVGAWESDVQVLVSRMFEFAPADAPLDGEQIARLAGRSAQPPGKYLAHGPLTRLRAALTLLGRQARFGTPKTGLDDKARDAFRATLAEAEQILG